MDLKKKKNLKVFFSQVLLKDKEPLQAYRRMGLLFCFEIFSIRYLWEALIAPPSLLLLLEAGSHLWHSSWEWCRQGESSLPYTQLPSGTGDCALQHTNGTKWIAVVTLPLVAPKAHLEQQYTEMCDLQAIISPVMSSCFRGLNTLQSQVLENEDFIEEKSYSSRNPFYVSSKLSLASMQKWDLQLLSLGFILVSDVQNACYHHQGNKKKLTKFLWNSQILSSDRHLNQLLRTSH